MAPDVLDLVPSSVFNRRLGRGAMAEVYLAQQVSLDRQIALKVLNADLALDPNYVRRFHHEAKAAAALVHGAIVLGHVAGILGVLLDLAARRTPAVAGAR